MKGERTGNWVTKEYEAALSLLQKGGQEMGLAVRNASATTSAKKVDGRRLITTLPEETPLRLPSDYEWLGLAEGSVY